MSTYAFFDESKKPIFHILLTSYGGTNVANILKKERTPI